MSNLSGLILQSKTPSQKTSNLNLLILAASNTDVTLILKSIEAGDLAFTYDIASTYTAYKSLLQKNIYDAVLFNYDQQQKSDCLDSPLNGVKWLHKSGQNIPFILITEGLGDEAAVELIKAGVTDYILKDKLLDLPKIMERSLFHFEQKRQQQLQINQIYSSAQQHTIINRIIQKMRETLVVDEILQTTVDLIHETLGVACCFLIPSDSNNHMRVCHVSKATHQREKFLHLCCQVADYYRPLLVEGNPLVYAQIDHSLPSELREKADQYQIRSMMLMPLFYQKSYLGGICLHHFESEHQWSQHELTIVQTLATQCAIAIHQAQLFEQIQQQKQREQLVNQISHTLNSSLDPEEILLSIVNQVGESFKVERVIIFSLDKKDILIDKEWRVNDQIPSLLNRRMPISQCPELIEPNCTRSRLFYSQNYPEYGTKYAQERIKQEVDYAQTRSVLSVPMFIHNKFFGGLSLHTTTHIRTFSEEEINTVQRIAEQGAIALYNAQTYERLEEEFRSRTQELEKEKQRSEEANRAKSEFLSTMSHELRTPLTGIIGFSRMLLEQIYGVLNDKQIQYVNAISASGQHLLELINDLLDISKIEAEREELFVDKIPVEDVCLASISIVKERARQEGLELKLDIDDHISFCVADKRRLKQVLVNLLSNAIKFTEKGSVTLKVEQDEKMIDFSVIDTGIGIKEDDQHKLFQPFQQIDNHLSRQYKGTGLGLALSRKLAKLHGGDLTVKSEEGKGSCFTIHLPA
ncbi:MAG: GAF domain-containing protein [Moorea sp. SIO2B7]|nr:GAF domain-containing protein [Moorena sp. SIO2B7]